MIATIILQAIVLFGTVQTSKPFAHLIFVRLCLVVLCALWPYVIVLFKTAGYRDKFMAYDNLELLYFNVCLGIILTATFL